MTKTTTHKKAQLAKIPTIPKLTDEQLERIRYFKGLGKNQSETMSLVKNEYPLATFDLSTFRTYWRGLQYEELGFLEPENLTEQCQDAIVLLDQLYITFQSNPELVLQILAEKRAYIMTQLAVEKGQAQIINLTQNNLVIGDNALPDTRDQRVQTLLLEAAAETES